MSNWSPQSKVFITAVIVSGMAVLVQAILRWKGTNWTEFLVLLLVAIAASRLRVKMPGVTGTLSVNLPFVLIAVAAMSTAEALAIGCLSTLAQCLPRAKQKFNWIQGGFNVANMALAVGATRLLYDSAFLQSVVPSRPLLLALSAAGFYLVNSLPVAIIMALTERRSAFAAWLTMVQLSYPYYVASAAVAGLIVAASAHVGWLVPLLALPIMAGMFYSYRRYFQADSEPQPEPKRLPQSAGVARAAS